jgi:hypothetical protein
MGKLITDEILDAFAISGSPDDLPSLVIGRYRNLVDRVALYAPCPTEPEYWASVVAGFRGLNLSSSPCDRRR